MSLAIANQYAKALLDVLSKPAAQVPPERVVEQLAEFDTLLRGSPDLKVALLSPALSPERKTRVLGRIAEQAGMAPETVRFLSVVSRKRRLGLLTEIRIALQAALDARQGVARAQVASAREMTGEQRQQIEAGLTALTGMQVRCDYSVDPSLIGGVTARVGSRFYDGSVLGQIETLRSRLTAEA